MPHFLIGDFEKEKKKIRQNDINLLKGIKQTFNNRMIDNKLLYEN